MKEDVAVWTLLLMAPFAVAQVVDSGLAIAPTHDGGFWPGVLVVAAMIAVGLFILKIKAPATYAKIMAGGKTVGGQIATGTASAVAAGEAGYHAAVKAAEATNAASPPTAAGPPTTK